MKTCLDNIIQNEDWLMAGKDQKAGNFLLKDGRVKKAGKIEVEMKPSCDVWNFWCQKAPMIPETPATAPGNQPDMRRCTGNDMPGKLVNTRDATYNANV